MCGRVFQTHNLQRLIQIARTSNVRNGGAYNPSFNAAPTSYLPAVRQSASAAGCERHSEEQIAQERDDLELAFLRWGHDAGFAFVINARVEELQEKRMFKSLLNSRRCAVIVEGYYEWNARKEPYSFRPKELKDHFYIAALSMSDESVVLLTRPAVKSLEFVHDRMPVLLEGEELDLWLGQGQNSFGEIIDKRVLKQENKVWGNVGWERLGPAVNDVKNKSPKCLMNYAEYMKELDQKGIKRFFKAKEPGSTLKEGNEPRIETKDSKVTGKEKQANDDQGKEKHSVKTFKTPLKRKETEKEKLEGRKQAKTLTKTKANVYEDADVVNALKAFIKN